MNNNELNGLKLEPCGEPNLYWLMRDAGWVAKIQMNGFFTAPKQEAILGAMLAAAKPADIDRDAISNALLSSLGTVYDCTRVWSAWSHGTMGPDDFVPLDMQDDRIEEVVDAVISALPASNAKEKSDASVWEPLYPVMLNHLDGSYWLATSNGRVVIGVYEWRQGHNPHGFKTDGGERIGAEMVTHLKRFIVPAHPSATKQGAQDAND